MARPDVLLVSLGTTLGWRVADELLLEQLGRGGRLHGRGVRGQGRRRPPAARLPAQRPGRDARGTPRGAHRRRASRAARPDRLLHHSGDAAAGAAGAVRDPLRRPRAAEPAGRAQRVPARARAARDAARAGHDPVQRGGRRGAAARAPRGRSSCRRPWIRRRRGRHGIRRARAAGGGLRAGPEGQGTRRARGRLGRPPRSPDARLEVFGLDPDWARSHLRRTGVPEPATLDLRGTVPAAEFRARLRRAHAYVAGARWEDWGQAPLEALADGALLATVPSGGPVRGPAAGARARRRRSWRARSTARRSPRRSAPRSSMPEERVRAYRERAAELMRPYRSEAVQETVTRELLPALLG